MRLSALFLSMLLLAACSSGDEPTSELESPTSAEASGEIHVGDTVQGTVLERELSRDGKVVVGISDEVVFLHLSEKTQAETQAEIDAEFEGASGLKGQIGDLVSGVVDSVIDTMVQVPLADVGAMRYANESLLIEGLDGSGIQIGDEGDEGIPFDRAAAERLIRAFENAR